jgi:adenylate kinase
MHDLIERRLRQADAAAGFILDGFPRTEAQVAILDDVMQKLSIALDGVYLLGAPEEEIVRRLGGRRVCPKCSMVYHIETNAPRSAGVCDGCASALVQRPDDTEGVIRERLQVYAGQTLPIVETYKSRGLLREIDGTGSPERVSARMTQTVGQA